MTTRANEQLYLLQHQESLRGRGVAVFNPHCLEVDDLPVIWAFVNGGSPGWYNAVAFSDDGVVLAGHICSDEGYAPSDLGVIEGTCPDKHEIYRDHYPDGYRMAFLTHEEAKEDPRVAAAIERMEERETGGAR